MFQVPDKENPKDSGYHFKILNAYYFSFMQLTSISESFASLIAVS